MPLEAKIIKDEPIEIKGDFIFNDSEGKVSTELKEKYICRCGSSNKKPFCDGTYKRNRRNN